MKTKFSVELDEQYYNQLKKLAVSEFRTTKAMSEMIIIKYLDNKLSVGNENE